MSDTSPSDQPALPSSSAQIDAWAATLARGESVTLQRSRGKSLLLAVVMAVLTLIGIAMVLSGDLGAAVIGAFLVLCGGLSVVVLLRRALSRKPASIVSAEGITVWNGSAGPVPWDRITGFSLMGSGASTFVMLAVTEEERRRQASGTVSIGIDQTELGEEAPSDETAEPVLWLPNGLTVDEVELIVWLEQERVARGGV